MGDRANIVIRDTWPDDLGNKEAVFLYTHWGGTELPDTLRRALSSGGRWDDPQYLARIVFQAMLGDDVGETGYGISTRLGDNEYDLIVLREERVYLLSESAYLSDGFAGLGSCPSCSFADVRDAEGTLTWERLKALCSAAAV